MRALRDDGPSKGTICMFLYVVSLEDLALKEGGEAFN